MAMMEVVTPRVLIFDETFLRTLSMNLAKIRQ